MTNLQVLSSHVFKHPVASLSTRLHVGQKLLQRQESKLEVANERETRAKPPAPRITPAPLSDLKHILLATLCAVDSERYCCSYMQLHRIYTITSVTNRIRMGRMS